MHTLQRFSRHAILVAALVLSAQILPPAANAQESSADKQRRLIAILQSNAKPAEKAIPCKQLAICGTKDAVPALAPLLANPELASWARVALEAIPDPAADEALREAVGKLQGKLLVGAINSIGVRRDAKAIAPLSGKLKDADVEVASAAAVALGHIGGAEVIKTLEPLLSAAPAAVRPAVAEGCILCAEKLMSEQKLAEAVSLYDKVRAANVSKPMTVEATRGAILARKSDGLPLLIEQFRSPDKAMFNIGLRTAREMPGPEVAKALLAEMEKVTPERQPYFLLAMADRGDAEALPAALKAAKASLPDLRLIAVGVLERLANPSCLPALLSAATDDDPELAQTAKSTVVRFPGTEPDPLILAMMAAPQEKCRIAGIELAAQRRIPGALPLIMKSAEDANPAISAVSLRSLGDMAGEPQIPALIAILLKAKETQAAESALSAVCARLSRTTTGNVVIKKAEYGALPDGPSADVTKKVAEMVKGGATTIEATNKNFGDTAGGKVKKLRVEYTINGASGTQIVAENDSITLAVASIPPAIVDALCAAMASAPAAPKLALLRIMRSAGSDKALATVRAAASDPNAEIKDTATRILCEWPAADALPDVTQLAKTSADAKIKILALRACFRLIPLQNTPDEKKFAAVKEVIALAVRDEEKRLALAALETIPTAESLALVATQLTDPNLKDEAALAAVSIAEKIVTTHPAPVADAMQKVSTTNDKTTRRAKALLNQAQKAAKK
ncbi:MAG: hypothetical protein NTX50_18160 [Candidatus Sumerlaeota bacterium]|nr:hypothetical protein [Candidatus Sumerlaeota bacterium]